MRRIRGVSYLLLLFLTLPALPGCATTQGGSSRSQDLIERDEIVAANATTAYDLIRRLRPNMLNVRGRSVASSGDASAEARSAEVRSSVPVVYLDGMRFGEIESLRQITADDIREIRFIDASTATMRWGTGHGGGVIHVRTRSGG